MKTRSFSEATLWTTFCLISAFIFSGCAVGQSVAYNHRPDVSRKSSISPTQSVSLKVSDDRSFVKDRSKPPSYIGKFRGGYGNPWDVLTDGQIPLADQFKKDLQKELLALGFKSDPAGTRTLSVAIVDYNFDSYVNARHWFNINVSVLDAAGNVLAKAVVKDEKTIHGSFWTGPIKAVKRDLPVIYDGIIAQILQDPILQALAK